MDNLPIKELIQTALDARKNAYAPYSHYQVGAALLSSDGTIYSGCNIENASYGATNCAERTAFFKAVSEGENAFRRIAIVGGKREGNLEKTAPCGVCLQVMQEFCDPEEFEIILATDMDQYERLHLRDLLPYGFELEKGN